MESQHEPKDIVTPSASESPIDPVFAWFMKIFFYEGIAVFLPYLLINIIPSTEILSESTNEVLVTLLITSLGLLFLMDNFAIRSTFLDRISRAICLGAAFFGTIGALTLLLSTRDGWNNNNHVIVLSYMFVSAMFIFLGWYFIRAERGLLTYTQKPSFYRSMVALFICALLYLLEYYLSGAILVGIIITFVAFPVALSLWGKLKVVPQIKEKNITIPYKRATLYNFIIDMIKAAALIMTIMSLLFNGEFIVYVLGDDIAPYLWLRNLAVLCFIAALTMGCFAKIKDWFLGLVPIIFVLIVAVVQYLLANYYRVSSWWLISGLSGCLFAGVFYFIEQKMDSSANVRAMPGSFYMMIYVVFALTLFLRADLKIDQFFENIKFIFSVLGIAYIYGYVRAAPMQKSLRFRI